MDIYVCKLFLFCLIFFYTRQGRAAATPITFRYSRRSDVTIHKHAIPGEKNYMGKKNEKRLYKHTPYASPFLEKKYMGKKKEKRIYTHTLHIYLCVYIYLCV